VHLPRRHAALGLRFPRPAWGDGVQSGARVLHTSAGRRLQWRWNVHATRPDEDEGPASWQLRATYSSQQLVNGGRQLVWRTDEYLWTWTTGWPESEMGSQRTLLQSEGLVPWQGVHRERADDGGWVTIWPNDWMPMESDSDEA
jgi:hypothetical protein